MDLETVLPLLMFLVLFALILTGFPVAFVLAGTGLIFALIGSYLDLFYLSDFGFLPAKVFGIVSNFTLVAVPLFIFMGFTLEKSGVAEDLLETTEILFRRVRGGLTISIVFVGALLAASTGIVGATVVTMGVLSLPTLIAKGYNKQLSCGTIAASGTLGQIIPPSIVLVLLGDMMNIAIADLFAAALVPGVMLVLLYMLYIFIRSYLDEELTPATAVIEKVESGFWKQILSTLFPPFVLITLVLGSILFGVASPTESAACGAMGALAIAFIRKKLSFQVIKDISERTTVVTAMVFTLLLGAQLFAVVFRGLYGDDVIADFIGSLEIHQSVILIIVMMLLFILGFFLDFIEICFIVVPIITPLLVNDLGVDPLWLAVIIAINLQTSFLTPPFGFALFYLKGVAPPEISSVDIYKGVLPFVLIQLLAICVVWIFPATATWLPKILFGDG